MPAFVVARWAAQGTLPVGAQGLTQGVDEPTKVVSVAIGFGGAIPEHVSIAVSNGVAVMAKADGTG